MGRGFRVLKRLRASEKLYRAPQAKCLGKKLCRLLLLRLRASEKMSRAPHVKRKNCLRAPLDEKCIGLLSLRAPEKLSRAP